MMVGEGLRVEVGVSGVEIKITRMISLIDSNNNNNKKDTHTQKKTQYYSL